MNNLHRKASPKVAVIIVNWNGIKFLERCLTAVMAQTVKPHEIILIDNASSDGSLEIARQFPGIKVIALDVNTGFARGNNLAIEAVSADTEWVALINPDAFAEPDWLEQLLNVADSNPNYSVFASRQLMADNPQLLDGDGDIYHMSGLAWRKGHGHAKDTARHDMLETFSPCAAAALYRLDAFKSVGGFDEDYFCYFEDVDLGFRLRLLGYRCLLIPGAIVKHMGSATTGGKQGYFSVYHGHRNLVWTYVKNMPGILFWVFLPLHLLLNLATVMWFSLHGQALVILRAKFDALLGLPKMWRKRKLIQQRRNVSVGDIWRVMNKQLFLSK